MNILRRNRVTAKHLLPPVNMETIRGTEAVMAWFEALGETGTEEA